MMRKEVVGGIGLLALVALAGCSSTPAVRETSVTTPDPRSLAPYERYECASRESWCTQLAYDGYLGNSIFVDEAQSWELMKRMCAEGSIKGCSTRHSVVSSELQTYDFMVSMHRTTVRSYPAAIEPVFESSSGMSLEDARAFASESRAELEAKTAGSCERGEAFECGVYIGARYSEVLSAPLEDGVAAPEGYDAAIAAAEAMCESDSADRARACVYSALHHKRRGNDERFDELVSLRDEALYQRCSEQADVDVSVSCVPEAVHEERLERACNEGDPFACGARISNAGREVELVTLAIERHRGDVMMRLGVTTYPESFEAFSEAQMRSVGVYLEMMEESKAELEGHEKTWRSLHRVGCVEHGIPEVCASWRRACEGAEATSECAGLP